MAHRLENVCADVLMFEGGCYYSAHPYEYLAAMVDWMFMYHILQIHPQP
jgi:hypothetical protein